ncbi:hypothetical protein [Variovorax ginsengisoli]|uniref:Uncharacterized protein n=1 Tax=Variovorax ginsengisoli TaxID=363844 RepID=A0ABT8SC22_9BURK|nr:hypothetical protein [Variovorax ginsengisoli]MDN8617299.1 hypothetical protein [Variovorax ginsengisoli]MDO1536469.1 hypothetical protein [Variovorax ginsengisoli]
MAEIRFLTNEAGKVEGLAYAGFETFRGSPYTSCARETGQNSRDASAGGHPVCVSFDLRSMARSDVPFADKLQHSIECCLAATHDVKTLQHLTRALQTINAPVIKVLEISDRHTTGLTGPTTDPESVFSALVKGDGVTNKRDATSAGSFGIGKNAAFAVSDLQTVIYSTCYRDAHSGEKKFAAQGRLRLVSHTDGDKQLSAEGYWGNAGFTAIESSAEVPTWMARDEVGASIFSIGFREQDHWEDRMTLSLVTNFFLAIERGEIEFSVGGKPINRVSLDSVLAGEMLQRIAAEADQLEELERARRLVECMRSEATLRRTISVSGLGNFMFHLLVKEGMPREVHVLRNGIYITDNFARFSEPLRRFPGTREFTAVLEPAQTPGGREPSSLLKRLENPAHDSLEPERIVDTSQREAAKKQIKSLIKQMRDIIRSVAKIDDISRSQLNELSHLFADGGDGGCKNVEEDPERFLYGSARKNRRAKPPGALGKGTGKGGAKGGATKMKTGKGDRRSAGGRPALPLRDLRSVLPDQKDASRRTIFFTPDMDGDMELSVAASGLSGDVELVVTGSSSGRTANGRIALRVRKGERVGVDVAFAEPFRGPIELTAIAVKTQELA